MKRTTIFIAILLCATALCVFGGYKLGNSMREKTNANESGYIARPEIAVPDGRLTPEVMLSLGHLSDPQLSPDGSTILYGVSYTSIEQNRSCRNLYVCDRDGRNPRQITHYAKSVSNARWSADGKSIRFVQDGQIWVAPYRKSMLGKKSENQ